MCQKWRYVRKEEVGVGWEEGRVCERMDERVCERREGVYERRYGREEESKRDERGM